MSFATGTRTPPVIGYAVAQWSPFVFDVVAPAC